jgi:opacity protein-like surface antigen
MKFALFSTALLASSIASAYPAIDGWYFSAFGGYSHLSSNINNYYFGNLRSDVRYHNGYNAGGRIGFQSNPIRYEFEYTYVNASPDRFHINYINQIGVNGHATSNMVMGNLYYDFPEILDAISPFVGVGIGYSFMEVNLDSTGPFGATFFKASKDVFTYQGTVGLTYNFSENYAINAAYRYAATGNGGHLGGSTQIQMGNAGVIYRFDRGNYK